MLSVAHVSISVNSSQVMECPVVEVIARSICSSMSNMSLLCILSRPRAVPAECSSSVRSDVSGKCASRSMGRVAAASADMVDTAAMLRSADVSRNIQGVTHPDSWFHARPERNVSAIMGMAAVLAIMAVAMSP